ncbi:MAG: hypothetical protein ACJ798_10900 [Phenylobacterium sp.]
MLRILIVSLALAGAFPAAAQDLFGLSAARDADRLAAEQAIRQREIAITNELSRLQAQAQTSQAASDIAALRVQPVVPTVPYDPKAPPPKLDTRKLAQIPDAALADSNAKVRAAADNRR